MSKLDQLRALREAKVSRKPNQDTPEAPGTARKAPSGLLLGKPKRGSARASILSQVGDGVALKSMEHPPGLKRGPGRPKVTGKRPWEIEGVSKRTYYRRRQKEAKQ